MKRNLMALCGMALLAWGCSTVSISSDYDPKANFTNLKTYDWAGSRPMTGNARLDTDILHERIKNATERELSLKGFRKVTTNPNFKVAYHVGLEDKVSVATIPSYGYAYPSYYSGSSGFGRHTGYWPSTDTSVYQYEEGTLILDIVNPETKKLIWRGTAKAEVNVSDSPERKEARINKAVTGILEKFPPVKS